jgi:hypothetical protein
VQVILNVLFQIQVAEFHIEEVMRSPGKPSLPKNTNQMGMSAIAQELLSRSRLVLNVDTIEK